MISPPKTETILDFFHVNEYTFIYRLRATRRLNLLLPISVLILFGMPQFWWRYGGKRSLKISHSK